MAASEPTRCERLTTQASFHVHAGWVDTWGASLLGGDSIAVYRAIGAFDLQPGSTDAGDMVLVPAGATTMHVRGKGGGKGIALVEVYELD